VSRIARLKLAGVGFSGVPIGLTAGGALAHSVDMIPAEVMVALPSNLTTVTYVRSTLIQASLESLRIRNLVDRYASLLPEPYHEPIMRTLAPTWMPLDTAMAHYRACEQLDLLDHEQIDIGGDVGRRVQRSSLSTIVRASKAAGVTPWLGLTSIDRLWFRLMQGGGVSVTKIGPKDARIVIDSVPLAEFRYFRNGFRGLIHAAAELFSNKSYVHTMHAQCSPMRLTYKLSWA
jgi:hypothetical protein